MFIVFLENDQRIYGVTDSTIDEDILYGMDIVITQNNFIKITHVVVEKGIVYVLRKSLTLQN
jgi:hypothetical protein